MATASTTRCRRRVDGLDGLDGEETRMRIALFVTCLGDVLFPDVARATVTVLERLGHEVVFPEAQTCCGQMHTNTGYQHDAVGPRAPPRRRLRAGAGRGL